MVLRQGDLVSPLPKIRSDFGESTVSRINYVEILICSHFTV